MNASLDFASYRPFPLASTSAKVWSLPPNTFRCTLWAVWPWPFKRHVRPFLGMLLKLSYSCFNLLVAARRRPWYVCMMWSRDYGYENIPQPTCKTYWHIGIKLIFQWKQPWQKRMLSFWSARLSVNPPCQAFRFARKMWIIDTSAELLFWTFATKETLQFARQAKQALCIRDKAGTQ